MDCWRVADIFWHVVGDRTDRSSQHIGRSKDRLSCIRARGMGDVIRYSAVSLSSKQICRKQCAAEDILVGYVDKR